MSGSSSVLVAAVAATVVACADAPGGSDGGWRAERDTVGDTVVVRTVAGSIWGDTARLVERLSIGVPEGTELEMLGNVRAIAVARDGSIYVTDAVGPVIRSYGPDGAFRRVIGRKGAGPGEYIHPDGGLGILRDGRLIVRDPGNGRLSLYAPDGEPAGAWRISGNLRSTGQLFLDTTGAVYTIATIPAPGFRLGLWRFGPDGTPGDTSAAPTWDFEPGRVTAEANGNMRVANVPFSPNGYWTFSPLGYYAAGLSTRYAVDLLRPGAPRLRIERTTTAVPVGDEEAAAAQRAITEDMRTLIPGWVWNGPAIPSRKPPFRGLLASEEGNIWVTLSRPAQRRKGSSADAAEEWVEEVAFDVYQPDGRYLGVVRAPDGFRVEPAPVLRGDTAWAVAEDGDGVQYVKRYEIVRARR